MQKIVKFLNNQTLLSIFLVGTIVYAILCWSAFRTTYLSLGQPDYFVPFWISAHLEMAFLCSLFVYIYQKKWRIKYKKRQKEWLLFFSLLLIQNVFALALSGAIEMIFLKQLKTWSEYVKHVVMLLENYYLLNSSAILIVWAIYRQLKLMMQNYLSETHLITNMSKESINHKTYFFVNKVDKDYIIEPHEIDYIQADGNYMDIIVDNEKFPIRDTLSNLEKKLETFNFIRVNRSTIINLKYIEQMKGNEITLKNKKTILIAESRKDLVLNTLNYS